MKQIKTSGPKNNKEILKSQYNAIVEQIKKIRTKIKTEIYN